MRLGCTVSPCVGSAFDVERERGWREREAALRVQVAQLEATLRADVGEKGTILDQLTNSKGASPPELVECLMFLLCS